MKNLMFTPFRAAGESGGTSPVVAEGQCGNDVFWRFCEDGVLSVYGNGDMWDYAEKGAAAAPWMDCKKSIKSLVMTGNITGIGSFAFKDCVGFTGVLTIPDSVTYIGPSAFDGCNFSNYP